MPAMMAYAQRRRVYSPDAERSDDQPQRPDEQERRKDRAESDARKNDAPKTGGQQKCREQARAIAEQFRDEQIQSPHREHAGNRRGQAHDPWLVDVATA